MKKFLKINLRKIQGYLEKRILGGFIQSLIWRSKHLYQKDWPEISLSSTELPHRKQLASVVAGSLNDIQSVLEIGCAAAPNLRLVRQKLPSAQLVGIDINQQAVKTANDYFKSVGDGKSICLARKAHELSIFKDSTFDVCFSQAVMVCHPPHDFIRAVKEILRVTKGKIIFNEYHQDGAVEGLFDAERWVYDYISVFKKLSPEAEITMQRTDFCGGGWDDYGKLITVSLTS